MSVNLENVLVVPRHIGRTPGLCADVVLREDTSRCEDQRELAARPFFGRHVFGNDEPSLTAGEAADMHGWRAFRSLFVARPLDTSEFVDLFETDAAESRGQAGDLVHDFGRMRVEHRITHGVGDGHRDFPVRQTGDGWHYFANKLN